MTYTVHNLQINTLVHNLQINTHTYFITFRKYFNVKLIELSFHWQQWNEFTKVNTINYIQNFNFLEVSILISTVVVKVEYTKVDKVSGNTDNANVFKDEEENIGQIEWSQHTQCGGECQDSASPGRAHVTWKYKIRHTAV